MAVRRRLLPTAIVGGLLAAGVSLGIGTAEAAVGDTCSIGDAKYTIVKDGIGSSGGACTLTDALPLLNLPAGYRLTSATTALRYHFLRVAPVVTPAVPTPDAPSGTDENASAPVPPAAGSTTSTKPLVPTSTPQKAVVPVVPPAVAPQAPALAAGAVGVAPAVGVLDADFSPVLLSNGTYDPALLLGAAPGVAPMLAMSSGDPASAVTTASQVQAMALQGAGGLGLPAVAGVIILAGLGGVAVRYRLRKVGGKTAPSA